MPADPRRHRERFGHGVTVLLIAGEVEDVAPSHYDFFNHCCPRDVRQRYRRKPSHKRSVQCSNFSREIEAAVDGRAIVFLTFACGRREVRAFSSEVDTGSREENASKQKIKEPGSDSIRIDRLQGAPYNHRFHLKNIYGSTAASTITTTASG